MTDDALRAYELAVWESLVGARPAPPRSGGPAPDAVRADLERIWAASAQGPGGEHAAAPGGRRVRTDPAPPRGPVPPYRAPDS